MHVFNIHQPVLKMQVDQVFQYFSLYIFKTLGTVAFYVNLIQDKCLCYFLLQQSSFIAVKSRDPAAVLFL